MLPVFIMAIEDDSDRQFAAELYHSYHSIMHQKALSILKKEDLAEDAVQDAMLKIICHLDKIREIPKREIPFYLIAITQTTCIDRYRKIQREKYIVSESQLPLMGTENIFSRFVFCTKAGPKKLLVVLSTEHREAYEGDTTADIIRDIREFREGVAG